MALFTNKADANLPYLTRFYQINPRRWNEQLEDSELYEFMLRDFLDQNKVNLTNYSLDRLGGHTLVKFTESVRADSIPISEGDVVSLHFVLSAPELLELLTLHRLVLLTMNALADDGIISQAAMYELTSLYNGRQWHSAFFKTVAQPFNLLRPPEAPLSDVTLSAVHDFVPTDEGVPVDTQWLSGFSIRAREVYLRQSEPELNRAQQRVMGELYELLAAIPEDKKEVAAAKSVTVHLSAREWGRSIAQTGAVVGRKRVNTVRNCQKNNTEFRNLGVILGYT